MKKISDLTWKMIEYKFELNRLEQLLIETEEFIKVGGCHPSEVDAIKSDISHTKEKIELIRWFCSGEIE